MGHRSLPALLALAALATGCHDLGEVVHPAPQVQLSASSLDFGTVAVNQSTTRTLTVTNAGTGAFEGTASLSGAGYSFVSGGGAFTLEPGGARDVVLRFTPADVGTFPGTLELGGEALSVTLTGIGEVQGAGASCLVLPPEIDFGFVASGHSAPGSFQVFSVGSAALSVNVVSTASDVQVTSGGGTALLAPGTSKTVELTFRPLAGGRREGRIAVGSICSEVTVLGVGTTVSFANDLRPIFTRNCAAGCHSWHDPTSGYAMLVGAPSSYYPPNLIVKPFDPSNSVLYGLISDSGQYGPSMPRDRALLPLHDRELFRSWILEGATDN